MKVSDFERLGVQLGLRKEGRLKFSAPKGIMTPEILCQIRENKWALVQELAGERAPVGQQVPALTDRADPVTGLSTWEQSRSDGCAECDGFILSLKRTKNDQEGEICVLPYSGDSESVRRPHIEHSVNDNNKLNLHSARQKGPGSVTGREAPKGDWDQDRVGSLVSRLGGDFSGGKLSGFRMSSGVLKKEVGVSFPRDNLGTVLIDDVIYQEAEIKNLLLKNLDPRGLQAVHEIKRAFEGTVCEGVQAMG